MIIDDFKKSGGMLVSDFDGTMTQFDFYDLACRAFPDTAGNFWHDYEAKRITHFEALQSIFAGIRADEQQLLEIISAMKIDPDLSKAVEMLRKNGWDVVVASAGCDWYIRRLLEKAGVTISVHANPGQFTSGQGLQMRPPMDSPFYSPQLGVNKVAVVRDALQRYERVAFAGDGRPDLPAALLLPPERRFAKSWLAKKLSEIGEGFHSFERWSDVVEILQKQEGWK